MDRKSVVAFSSFFLSVLMEAGFGGPSMVQKVKSVIFQEDLSIGIREGPEDYMFGKTIMVNADDEGNFYVTDWDRKQIRKYDPLGKYLLTFGRQGPGPGEFMNISTARFDRQGNVYALDFASRKIVFFDKNGKFLKQETFSSRFGDLQMTPAKTYLGIQSRQIEISGIPQFAQIYGIFDEQYTPIVEFYRLNISPPPPPRKDPQARAESISQSIFRPDPLYALGADGRIYYGFSARYAIDVYAPEGKKLRTIVRDCDPLKVRKKDKDNFFADDWPDYLVSQPEAFRNEVKRFIRFPKTRPFFWRLAPMENGWLAVVVDKISRESILLDLFDEDGRFLGRVEAKVPITNLFFKNGKAYAVKDEDGYNVVKRYRFEIR
jgi:hypothetical protein